MAAPTEGLLISHTLQAFIIPTSSTSLYDLEQEKQLCTFENLLLLKRENREYVIIQPAHLVLYYVIID